MKTTLFFNFDFHKAGKHIEKLSNNRFFLFTCKLVKWKKFVRNPNSIYESCLYCIDLNATSTEYKVKEILHFYPKVSAKLEIQFYFRISTSREKNSYYIFELVFL